MALTDEQIVNIGNKITVLQSEVADRLEAIENLKTKLAENLPHNEEQLVGDFKVNIFLGKKFDEAFGKKTQPQLWEKYAEEKKVLTSALAKAKMDPEEYALFQKPNSKTTVTVSLRED